VKTFFEMFRTVISWLERISRSFCCFTKRSYPITEKLVKIPALYLSLSYQSGVLPRSTNPAHIRENFDLSSITLSDEDMEELNGMHRDVHYCWDPNKIKWNSSSTISFTVFTR